MFGRREPDPKASLTATLKLPSGETVCALTDVLDVPVAHHGRRFLARAPKNLLRRSLPNEVFTVEAPDGSTLFVTVTSISLSMDEQSTILLGKIRT